VRIYTDGSGDGRFGYLTDEGASDISQVVGLTNNEAEYEAVILALTQFPYEDIEIASDSQLVVNQVSHKWAIKEDRLRVLAQLVWDLVGNRKVVFTWVPREQNLAGKMLG